MRAVEVAWPFNAHLADDERLREAMFSIVGQSSAEQFIGALNGHEVLPNGPLSDDLGVHCALLGTAFVLWNSVPVVVPQPMTTGDVERIARDTAPALALAHCDRCKRSGCTSALLVPFLPNLIGLTFCAGCSADLAVNAAPVRFVLPHNPEEE